MTSSGPARPTAADQPVIPPMNRPSLATIHGYPRQGRHRELKRATERYWKGSIDANELLTTAAELRNSRFQTMLAAGLAEVPVGDFSLYDHVLDTAVLVGALPQRIIDAAPEVKTSAGRLDRYFAAARGTSEVTPLEMTKWFDTNYHYLVPELGPDSSFTLDPQELLDRIAEAREVAPAVRPVLVGPYTFLRLAKAADDAPEGFEPITLLDRLVPVYAELLERLAATGVEWVQLDEPSAVTELDGDDLAALERAYARLAAVNTRPQILVGSYFDQLGDALGALVHAGVEGLALDFTGPAVANLEVLAATPGIKDLRLIAGVIDGRNVWRADLWAALSILVKLTELVDRVDVAASCSLLHVPIDVGLERDLDPAIISWLAFADQKLDEVVILSRGLTEGSEAVAEQLNAARQALEERRTSPIVQVAEVRSRLARVAPQDLARHAAYADRAALQRAELRLPVLPTTTIGSFPQTGEIRKARADLRAGRIDQAGYEEEIRQQIAQVVELQEELGLDVLVHGEPERNDMVQYFAEQLDGFISTAHGWVQSYGSRYVRPPILIGDVSRPRPMTVQWSTWAQSLTEHPMKGMLTGPVTILAWSFVRDDQPLAQTAQQVALALRDEIADLEAAGLRVIQVDEPALRETLPLRTNRQADYLRWAVDAFLLATAGVQDATQIHTHMCYAEFDEIIDAITAMDADVISLEAARSRMEVVGELATAGYPNEIGPGVWDIHSPRVPPVAEIADKLRLARAGFPDERIWANPDCGLKTRGYAEVKETLQHLVEAVQKVRKEIAAEGA